MIKAIVYTSKTGTTKEYANMLSEALNIPCYTIQEAKQTLHQKDEVIYLGWIMAGVVKKLNTARKQYDIKAVCAVGMMPNTSEYEQKLKESNKVETTFFYLQGGYVKEKQKGLYKFILGKVATMLKSKLEQKEQKTKDDIMMLDMINNGTSCVKKENVQKIIEFVNNH